MNEILLRVKASLLNIVLKEHFLSFLPWLDNRPKNNALQLSWLKNIALHFATVSKRGTRRGLILKPHLKSRMQISLIYKTELNRNAFQTSLRPLHALLRSLSHNIMIQTYTSLRSLAVTNSSALKRAAKPRGSCLSPRLLAAWPLVLARSHCLNRQATQAKPMLERDSAIRSSPNN